MKPDKNDLENQLAPVKFDDNQLEITFLVKLTGTLAGPVAFKIQVTLTG